MRQTYKQSRRRLPPPNYTVNFPLFYSWPGFKNGGRFRHLLSFPSERVARNRESQKFPGIWLQFYTVCVCVCTCTQPPPSSSHTRISGEAANMSAAPSSASPLSSGSGNHPPLTPSPKQLLAVVGVVVLGAVGQDADAHVVVGGQLASAKLLLPLLSPDLYTNCITVSSYKALLLVYALYVALLI